MQNTDIMVFMCPEVNCRVEIKGVIDYREHIKESHIATFSLDPTYHVVHSWKG